MPPSPEPILDTILVVDDEPDFVEGLCATLERHGYRALGATDLEGARAKLKENCVDLLLIDEALGRETGTNFLKEIRGFHSGMPAILISGHADLDMALAAMRAGAADMVPKPFQSAEILDAVRVNLEDSILLREARRNRWHAARQAGLAALAGRSHAMQTVIAIVRRVAGTDSTVLIEGESGTGKELIARAIHQASPRSHREMVAENFGALTQTLIEAALFGCKRGAYTGATEDRAGLFEKASGGTLFLDEIGEATPEVQARLLRVLEERVVTRVGDNRARPVDVRLIAATNRDLKTASEQGGFRADLYYRLGVLRIHVPPLRERAEDIEPIAMRLLDDLNRKLNRRYKGFARKAIDKLRQHPWPGNARELRNVIEAAVVVYAQSDWIQPEDLVLDRAADGVARFEQVLESPYRNAQAEFDRRYFSRLLKRAGGNKSRAAELAGIDRTNLYKHLERAGITE